MLRIAINSALAQTDRDFEIILIPDQKKRGIKWANKQFGLNVDRVDGQYVYTLDDDSKIMDVNLISKIKKLAAKDPDVIMVKCHRPQMPPNILPKEGVWGQRDKLRVSATNGGCFIVKAEVWKKYAHCYGLPGSGDWNFLGAVNKNQNLKFVWLDTIAKEAQQLGRGKKFEITNRNWLRSIITQFGFVDVNSNDWRLRGFDWRPPKVMTKQKRKKIITLPLQKAIRKAKKIRLAITPQIKTRVVAKRKPKKPHHKHSLPNRR
jgi:glycosyltransferase involved in cell wall biosynthesis